MIDPAFDMPRTNWLPQGSFEAGELALELGPDEGTLVCLPPINQDWLPYVIGCLDQLRNPSTWIVADDDAMESILIKVARLQQMFGGRAVCPVPFELRVDGCDLQSSTDGGDTWDTITGWSDFLDNCIPPQTIIDFDSGCSLNQSYDDGATFTPVAGWLDNFPTCVQNYTPIIGLPPNPGDQDSDQLACSIAAYIAENVVVGAMGKAVTAIQDDLTLLSFGLNVLDIIPEFVLVREGADAFSIIYAAVQDGTIADYEDAVSDGTLLLNIQCAIYQAIQSAGYVTPSNFAAIISGVEAVTYAHPDVVAKIGAYMEALGATGLAQLSQIAGLQTGADCSSCGTWCYKFDFTVTDAGVTAYQTPPGLTWTSGIGFTSQFVAGEAPPAVDASIVLSFAPTLVETATVTFQADQIAGTALRHFYAQLGGTNIDDTSMTAAAVPSGTTQGLTVSDTIDTLIVIVRSAGSTGVNTIVQCTLAGNGANPFGADNC